MPGPFPGMDPYLENPRRWPTVHSALINFIWMDLSALLPPPYFALMGERIYIQPPGHQIIPDVVALRPPAPRTSGSGGTAVADPPFEFTILSEPIHEPFVQIMVGGDTEQVVTIIEVLSPTNKVRGDGREEYVRKQKAILDSDTNLIEIDLLRGGEHTVVAPREQLDARKPGWHYVVSLHRGWERWEGEAWAVSVRERLPRIWVPLEEGVPDLVLDLQAIFDRNYDVGNYARHTDYTRDPVPPLEGEDAAWMDALLKEKGRRN